MSNDIQFVKCQGMDVSNVVFNTFDNQVCIRNLYSGSNNPRQIQSGKGNNCNERKYIADHYLRVS